MCWEATRHSVPMAALSPSTKLHALDRGEGRIHLPSMAVQCLLQYLARSAYASMRCRCLAIGRQANHGTTVHILQENDGCDSAAAAMKYLASQTNFPTTSSLHLQSCSPSLEALCALRAAMRDPNDCICSTRVRSGASRLARL